MLIRVFYTFALALAAPLLLLGLYKSKPNKPKFGSRWKEHFGYTPSLPSAKNTSQAPLWIHAVSVGESIAAVPLIHALKKRNPTQTIVVTTTTSTGAEQIAKLGDLVEHRYMPIDFSFAVRGFLNAIKPQKMLIIETELWPNTLAEVAKAGIPITVVNARLSEKSRRNYAKVQPLFNLLSQNLSQVLCQSQADAERFAALGIAQDKLAVTGSIKFDIHISDETKLAAKNLRNELNGEQDNTTANKTDSERPIWIAASTHKGEDEQVLAAHQAVLAEQPNALLILVPRHPERFDDVFSLCQTSGFNCVRRTSNQSVTGNDQVYLADTMGEMLTLMGAADLCFMGGSLIGDKVGGHNVLEPVALGLPVITGPSYFNFEEIVNTLHAEELLVITRDSHSLAQDIIVLLKNMTTKRNVQVRKNNDTSATYQTIKHIEGDK
ncbi:3-deoxy-D-manno-octulosonic acid transferase [Vibrio sp. 10N.286.49.B3]|uniref:lipid IV(A) 3-deoxy-D-manno-octulosonic acid transferase n=1 Tax=Vibrio sp. 10N.286.49.B3 TaxID=1880855 RepID=UPI000C866D62|nr:lipid IV(A) 3-deoxy-D-manno-octulosonic acid transferase [Vibrio sp. 10N.286.49.B3]PMH45981.1 3-deoxy-D-manno-octulosonic acid transferase [Vibrio sp. 10N.286.49.B3]